MRSCEDNPAALRPREQVGAAFECPSQTFNEEFTMKYLLGIDVAKAKLDVYLIDLDGQFAGLEATFENTLEGIGLLAQRLTNPQETCVLYESTGVYGKKLGAYLAGQVFMLCEVNPTIIKHAASTMTQTKTDATDARAIAQAARTLYLTRKQVLDNALIDGHRDEEIALWISEYDRLRRAISQLKCQIKTLQQHPAKAATPILLRMKRELKQLTQSQMKVHQKIERFANTREDIQRIASIKGIGSLTAAALANRIGSIQRFASADQLKAYLGLYPVQRQSGKQKKVTHLAKHGDKLIRHLMWNCAKSAARHNPACKQLFERLINKGNRMTSAWAAVMRKLVQIVYGVLKHQTNWAPEYHLIGGEPKS